MSFLKGKPADPLAGVMQGITPEAGGAAPGYTPQEMQNPDTAPLQNAMQAAAPQNAPQNAPQDAPQPRRSILSTIGQLSDVLANVGGAKAQYQSTLDANTARDNAMGDHTQQVDLNRLKLATAQGELGDAGRGRTALLARAYASLRKANPNADLSGAFSSLAQQSGIDPAHADQLRQMFDSQPGTAEATASFLDKGGEGGAKYGGNTIYGKKVSDGTLVAYQAGLGSEGGRSILPDGVTPIDPLKFVDTGPTQQGYGTRSGTMGPTITKSAKPDTVLTTQTQRDIAAQNNNTKVQVAGMPGRAKAPLAANEQYQAYSGGKLALSQMNDAMTELKNDPAIDQATGFIRGALDTPARQRVQATIARIQGMATPVAAAILRSQGVQRPTQSEIMSTAKGVISDLGLIRQDTGSYTGNIVKAQQALASRARLLDEGAHRAGILQSSAAPAPQQSNGGWSVVKVQ